MSASNPSSAHFSQRNVYYLRVSSHCVLQLILYLDASHLRWISANPQVFQRALIKLRTTIMPKLQREAGTDGSLGTVSKKEKVEVHSEGDFHMCYFFRKMNQRHAVLLKEKNLSFQSSTGEVQAPLDDADQNPNPSDFFSQVDMISQAANGPIPSRKRQKMNTMSENDTSRKEEDNNDGWGEMAGGMNLGMGFNLGSTSQSGTSNQAIDLTSDKEQAETSQSGTLRKESSLQDSSGGVLAPDSDDEDQPQRNEDEIVVKKEIEDDEVMFQGYGEDQDENEGMETNLNLDLGMQEGDEPIDIDQDELEDQEEDEKPKFKLRVSYSGFRILGKSLVLVIEPSTKTKNNPSNAHLFGSNKKDEVRELNLIPSDPLSTNNVRNGRRSSRSQSRFSSIQPPGDSRRSETPLFRGMTPASEIDDASDRGSVEPSPAPPSPVAKGSRKGKERARVRDRDENEITTVGAKRVRPPVPMFNEDRAGTGDVEEEQENGGDTNGFGFASQLLMGEEEWKGGSEDNGVRD